MEVNLNQKEQSLLMFTMIESYTFMCSDNRNFGMDEFLNFIDINECLSNQVNKVLKNKLRNSDVTKYNSNIIGMFTDLRDKMSKLIDYDIINYNASLEMDEQLNPNDYKSLQIAEIMVNKLKLYDQFIEKLTNQKT